MTRDEIRDTLYLANDVLQLRHNYDGYLEVIDKTKLMDVYRKIIATIPEDFELEKPELPEDPFGLKDKKADDTTFDF